MPVDDSLLEFVSQRSTVRGHAPAERVFFQHGVAQMINLGQEACSKGLSIITNARNRKPPKVHTMVAPFTAHETSAGCLAIHPVVGKRDLQGCIDSL